jgi:flagellar biosynthesis/type III secretory pathway M-ring protein FliF/YscJ
MEADSMPAIAKTFNTIITQMRQLPTSAKLFIGSLMVILAMSLLLVGLYAKRADLVALGVGANLSPENRASAIAFLQERGIPHDERADQLYVPPEQKYVILAQLNERHIISGDQINFASLMNEDSPFTDRATKRQRYLVAKMKVLEGMISQMSGIERATVVIDQPDRRVGIGDPDLAPSASVNIIAADALTQHRVDAIAALVTQSHAGMKKANVAIIDARTGRLHKARAEDTLSSSVYLERQVAAEKRVRDKLLTQLSYIPGVNVAVNAIVDVRDEVQQMTSYDEPKVGPLSESNRTSSSARFMAASEAGVRPNVGTSIADGPQSTMSDERSRSATLPRFGQKGSRISDPKGHALKINASVNVPKSYFVQLHADDTGDATAAPDSAALGAIVMRESERIRQDIEPLIDTTGISGAVVGTVRVSMYADLKPAAAGTGEVSAGLVGSLVGGGLTKNIGLGALALISLAMMFMMVRRAGTREELPTAEDLVGLVGSLGVEGRPVGEAGESPLALEGVEIDEQSLQSRQMLEQINEMARNNTADARADQRDGKEQHGGRRAAVPSVAEGHHLTGRRARSWPTQSGFRTRSRSSMACTRPPSSCSASSPRPRR